MVSSHARGQLVTGGLTLLVVSSIFLLSRGSVLSYVLGGVIFAGGIIMLSFGAIPARRESV